MRECLEGQLEVLRRRSIGTLCRGFRTSQSLELYGSLPQLAAKRMMSKPIDVVTKPIRIETFDDLGDPRMKSTAAFEQQRVVRDLIGQSMLEGVFQVGIQGSFIEELSSLQMGKRLLKRLL